MEVDAVGADFAQQAHQFGGGLGLTHRAAEGVAAGVPDRPEAKGEFVLGFWFVGCGHFIILFPRDVPIISAVVCNVHIHGAARSNLTKQSPSL